MRKFAILAAAVLCAGCSTVHTTMLSGNSAVISATGGNTSDYNRVMQQGLTEAAKLTRTQGYQYFIVVSAEDTTRFGISHMPGHIYGAQARVDRPIGTTNLGPSYFPGATYQGPATDIPYVRPGVDITIRMYRQGEIDPSQPGVWRADETVALAP